MSEQAISQEEIDALMSGGTSDLLSSAQEESSQDRGFKGEIIPYDLSDQDRIIRGRMPTLDIIHDRFVRMFRLTLSSALRKVVEIRISSTEQIKFGEYINTLSIPTSLNLFRMNPLKGNAMIVMETKLVFTLIDILFGGTGELRIKADGREFTAIEQKITKRLIIQALEDLHAAWRPVFPLQITYSRSEINPQFAAIVPYSETVLVAKFAVEMGRGPMVLTLCLPLSMVEPIRGQLQSGFQSDVNETDAVTLNRFKDNLQKAEVDVAVELGESVISVKNFLEYKIGDVIMLEQEASKPINVKVENMVKFRGHIGAHQGKQSIKITEMVYERPYVEEFK